ncbi:LEA/WHy family protein [Porticoccus sp.]
MRVMRAVWLLIALAGLSGCALLAPGQKPEVHLVNVQPGAHEGFEQHFVITLLVLNPTGSELNVSGLSYNLKLQGEKLISGAAGGMNPIPPYGQSTIKVPASANLISGLKIIGAFMESRSQSVNFELEARISLGWWRLPITVVEAGSIDLGER